MLKLGRYWPWKTVSSHLKVGFRRTQQFVPYVLHPVCSSGVLKAIERKYEKKYEKLMELFYLGQSDSQSVSQSVSQLDEKKCCRLDAIHIRG